LFDEVSRKLTGSCADEKGFDDQEGHRSREAGDIQHRSREAGDI
jgi:hypothetical protein